MDSYSIFQHQQHDGPKNSMPLMWRLIRGKKTAEISRIFYDRDILIDMRCISYKGEISADMSEISDPTYFRSLRLINGLDRHTHSTSRSGPENFSIRKGTTHITDYSRWPPYHMKSGYWSIRFRSISSPRGFDQNIKPAHFLLHLFFLLPWIP